MRLRPPPRPRQHAPGEGHLQVPAVGEDPPAGLATLERAQPAVDRELAQVLRQRLLDDVRLECAPRCTPVRHPQVPAQPLPVAPMVQILMSLRLVVGDNLLHPVQCTGGGCEALS